MGGTPFAHVPAPAVAIFRDATPLDLVVHNGTAEALAWPGVGSHTRSLHRIRLEASGGETPWLRHESESVYFVAEGSGHLGDLAVRARLMAYVPRRTPYRFVAAEPMLVVGGPCPPDLSLYGHGSPLPSNGEGEGPIRLFDPDTEGVPLPMIGKQVRLLAWPGVGCDIATMNFALLEPGEENQPHSHEASDDTIAILAGAGSIDDLTNGATHDFTAGDVAFVRAGIRHKVKADAGVPITSVGGPCPPDYGMLRALGLV